MQLQAHSSGSGCVGVQLQPLEPQTGWQNETMTLNVWCHDATKAPQNQFHAPSMKWTRLVACQVVKLANILCARIFSCQGLGRSFCGTVDGRNSPAVLTTAAPKDFDVDSTMTVGGWPDALLPVPRPLSTLKMVQVAFHRSIALGMHVLKDGWGCKLCAHCAGG